MQEKVQMECRVCLMVYERGISPKIQGFWGMTCEGHGWVQMVMHGYVTVKVSVLGRGGHENKARTVTNGCGGAETDTLRTRENRAIQEHNASEKKSKKRKTHTTNYRIVDS